jgi:hypothetical protein
MWSGISTFNYIFDEIMTNDLEVLADDWADIASGLANWLQDEIAYVVKQSQLSREDSTLVYRVAEKQGDEIIEFFAREIKQNASIVHLQYPQTTLEVIMYKFYIATLNRIIYEFDKIIRTSLYLPNELRIRYYNHIDFVRLHMIIALQVEQQREWADNLHSLALKLAKKWKESVESAYVSLQ